MFEYLSRFDEYYGPLRLLHFITLRTLMATGTAAVIGFIIGPWLGTARFLNAQSRRLFAGEPLAWCEWALHAGLVAGLLWAIGSVTGIPAWLYVVGVAYPAMGLMMVRSFLEHRPAESEQHRTAIVEAGWFWSLLFLNNNLHVVHHERPGEPWYRLPRLYASQRDAVLARNGGYVFAGYLGVARRHLLAPKDLPVHPS